MRESIQRLIKIMKAPAAKVKHLDENVNIFEDIERLCNVDSI